MSRIGIKPITIPDGITVDLKDNLVTVKGKTSTLTQVIHPNIIVEIADKTVNVKRKDNNKFNRSLHGLTRSLIYNMVEGVSKGFKKVLFISNACGSIIDNNPTFNSISSSLILYSSLLLTFPT